MRLFALLMMVVALRCFPAQAQDAGSQEALQAAQELTAILSQDTIAQMSRAMTAQVWPKIETEFRSKVDQATLLELRSEFERALERFVTDSMKGAPALYARYFSAQELRAMTAFYRTPAGAKSLQLMPQVMAEFYGALIPRMEAFQREIQELVNAVLKKHGFQQ